MAERATELISTYGIKANPVEVLEGLEAMPAGWDRLRVSDHDLKRSARRRESVLTELAEEEGLGQEAGIQDLSE